MIVFVLAGLLGLLGAGPLGHRSIAASDGAVEVEYERFLRRGTRTRLLVRVRPTGADAPVLELRLARSYLDQMRVESVFPTPRQVQAGRDHVVLDFEVDPRQPGPLTIAIHMLPQGIGGRWGAVGVGAGPELGFRQWVNP
jgi:hypothetical protein